MDKSSPKMSSSFASSRSPPLSLADPFGLFRFGLPDSLSLPDPLTFGLPDSLPDPFLTKDFFFFRPIKLPASLPDSECGRLLQKELKNVF